MRRRDRITWAQVEAWIVMGCIVWTVAMVGFVVLLLWDPGVP